MNLQDVFQFENGFLLNNDDSIHFEVYIYIYKYIYIYILNMYVYIE